MSQPQTCNPAGPRNAEGSQHDGSDGLPFRGLVMTPIVLGKYSGRHAFRRALEELEQRRSPQEERTLYQRFQVLAVELHQVTAPELEALIRQYDNELQSLRVRARQHMATLDAPPTPVPEPQVVVPIEVAVKQGRSRQIDDHESWRLCEIRVSGVVVGTVYVNLAGDDLLAQKAGKYMFANRPA